jgi:hypothetical protein
VSRLKDRRFRFILLISFLLCSLILYLPPSRIIPDGRVTPPEITNRNIIGLQTSVSGFFYKMALKSQTKNPQLSIVCEIIHKLGELKPRVMAKLRYSFELKRITPIYANSANGKFQT